MSRTDKEGVTIRESLIAELNVMQTNSQVMTGTVSMPVGAAPMQFMDLNGAVRELRLPPETKGAFHIIHNTAGGAFALTVKEDTGTTTIGVAMTQGKVALFTCDGTTWRQLLTA